MKKIFMTMGIMVLFMLGTLPAMAGDCMTRDSVDWHATITSAVFLRSACPTGDIVGTVPGGEVVEILEVDRFNEFYLVKTSVGTGFLFASFLKDITHSPMPGSDPQTFPDSIFIDLDPNHMYYDEIADVKARGIVSGTPEGKILADDPVNRAELAKILVEATTDDTLIAEAVLDSGIYSDIEAGAWYTRYLQIAREKDIVTGDGSSGGITTVRPGDNANGAEVAKMIAVAFGLHVQPAGAGQSWYVPYMNELQTMGILPYEKPSHVVTRGEMMFMISKALGQ